MLSRDVMETTHIAEPIITESDPDSLRSVYLQRLERLLGLRRKHEVELNRQGLRLLDRAIFAAYCACRDVGVEETARDVLRVAKVTLQPPLSQLDLGPAEDAQTFDWPSLRQAQSDA
ncbi:MAG: hypothetical protein WD939_08170 [Dehalococcoidia bacterium]